MNFFVLLLVIAGVFCEEVDYTCEPEPIYTVDCIAKTYGYVEGLFWSDQDNKLYWTDSTTSTIYRRDYFTGQIQSHHLKELDGENITCVIPYANSTEKFLICSGGDFRTMTAFSSDNYTLSEAFFSLPREYIINKAHTDETGRMIISTEARNSSSVLNEQIISKDNGLAPEEMLSVGRVIDFCIKDEYFWGVGHDYDCIHQFDYSKTYGILTGDQLIVLKSEKRITGIEVDDKSNLWYLREGNVFRWNLDNSYNNYSIPIAANNLTSVTFGGLNYNEIYVGSSNLPDTSGGQAGCIFRITGMRGQGEPDFPTNVYS